MSLRTGVQRVAIAIRWLGRGFGGLCVLGGVVLGLLWLFLPTATREAGIAGLVFLIAGALLWGIAAAVAWIIEGFAPDPDPNKQWPPTRK